MLQFIPYDDECLKWLNEINALGDLVGSQALPDSDDLTENVIPNSIEHKTTEPIIEKSYKIVESMATFTMVKVLKSQKHIFIPKCPFFFAFFMVGVLPNIKQ